MPHLRRDWAHPMPHLRRDWARLVAVGGADLDALMRRARVQEGGHAGEELVELPLPVQHTPTPHVHEVRRERSRWLALEGH